jgi:hypothetical protein
MSVPLPESVVAECNPVLAAPTGIFAGLQPAATRQDPWRTSLIYSLRLHMAYLPVCNSDRVTEANLMTP